MRSCWGKSVDTYPFDDPDSVVHFIIGFLLAAFFPFWFMAVGTLVLSE